MGSAAGHSVARFAKSYTHVMTEVRKKKKKHGDLPITFQKLSIYCID